MSKAQFSHQCSSAQEPGITATSSHSRHACKKYHSRERSFQRRSSQSTSFIRFGSLQSPLAEKKADAKRCSRKNSFAKSCDITHTGTVMSCQIMPCVADAECNIFVLGRVGISSSFNPPRSSRDPDPHASQRHKHSISFSCHVKYLISSLASLGLLRLHYPLHYLLLLSA